MGGGGFMMSGDKEYSHKYQSVMYCSDPQTKAEKLKAWFDETAADQRTYEELNDQERAARVDLQNVMYTLVMNNVDKQLQSYEPSRTPANIHRSHSMPLDRPEDAKEMVDILFDQRSMTHFTHGALIQQAFENGKFKGGSEGYDRGRVTGKEEGYAVGNFNGKVKGFVAAIGLIGVIALGVNIHDFYANKKQATEPESKSKTEQSQKAVVPVLTKN